MTDFFIAGTQSIPEIRSDWDAGALHMRGDSYPENSFELFNQVFEWIEQYLNETNRPLTLHLHLLYLNTSSIKAMMDIFDTLEAAFAKGREMSVIWSYDPRNERVAELAEEFREDCTFPFDIVAQSGP
ncbi:biofilm regulation phosphoprotein SiaC [Pseudomonas sp.]|uniref:biofilm regulation phosphoprotein SiaC n=1 Tax=Pseudomonas sp. TaxID=306 RepID=UPI00272A8348|nr:biofilm regulation phosphoprotein SiaC [Pseudomonas sp.]